MPFSNACGHQGSGGLHLPAFSPDPCHPARCAEALAAIGESNADNWVVMQKGLPLLIAMLQAPDLRQAEAAVSPCSLVFMLNMETGVACSLQAGSSEACNKMYVLMNSVMAGDLV